MCECNVRCDPVRVQGLTAAVLEAGCDIALNCWGKLEDMQGIADRVPLMTPRALARLEAACAPLRIAENSAALQARTDALLTRREALA